ncbi:small neutral amino acid transporter SnatA (MarC family) [Bradyrhizobium sp. CIR48]|uniref:hypothetical protein n=1 Tax=Bradyrhizobium sp. CIR48 TaxID=2663840 RepID=UPI001606BAAE|nr:hypothetical protein [Bradyrhizobium sp. CIR48]MBB4425832.1 small neutral amino acid transporter SnatA (MarC family) [Bradyrhizobium sp. CIR48]
MDDVTGSGLIADFLFGLGDLFVIINPYGLAFMARLFGEEAPVTKLSAFLLLCMGVQIIVTRRFGGRAISIDDASRAVQ